MGGACLLCGRVSSWADDHPSPACGGLSPPGCLMQKCGTDYREGAHMEYYREGVCTQRIRGSHRCGHLPRHSLLLDRRLVPTACGTGARASARSAWRVE